MDHAKIIRAALWTSAAFNLAGATMFAFPATVGRLAGMPAEAPLIYRAIVVLFVLLFAGVYAWLARRPTIDRPMVALGAIGKAGAFVAALGVYLAGQVPLLTVIAFSGDLALASVFGWWLLASDG